MRKAVIVLFLLLGFSPVVAQVPFGESLTVEVMNVDVVALDRNGLAVTDLAPEDFELLVNGRTVPVTNFSAYGSSPGKTVDIESAPEPERVTAAAEEPRPVTWLVYVDLLNTVRYRRKRALDQLEQFLRNGAFRAQDRILVAVFQGDAFRVVQPLTTRLPDGVRAMGELRNWARASRAFAEVDVDDAPEGPLDQEERERRVRVAINGLRDLTTLVDGIEGRVGLLIVSGGYDFSSFPIERARRLRTVYENVLARLVEGRITAYTVYAGKESFDGLGPDSVDSTDPLNDRATFSEVAAFAEETGGIAFTSTARELVRVRSDFDHYYSLGFRPPAHAPGTSLDIDVRVRRPGVKVRHRDAVRRRSDQDAARDVTMSALAAEAAPANPWGVQVRVGPIERKRPFGYRARIEVIVPLARVLLMEQNGRHAGRLIFHFAVRDAHGYFRRLEERELPLALAADEVEKARTKSIRYTVDLLVPAGTNDLAVTVADFAGSGRSTARAPVVATGRP